MSFLFHVLADLLPNHRGLTYKLTSNSFFHSAKLHNGEKERAVAAGC